MLTRLEIENYRSLHSVNVCLPQFSAMVGPNAAGKTNFADAIDFLSIVAKSGLPEAVTAKGGYDNLCFRRARRAKGAIRFCLEVNGIKVEGAKGLAELRFTYDFAIRATGRSIRSEFSVVAESLIIESRTGSEQWQLFFNFTTDGKTFRVQRNDKLLDVYLPPQQHLELMFNEWLKTRDNLLILNRMRGIPPFLFLVDYMTGFRLFQIMPSAARQPASASGTREMGRYGDNLPAALDALRKEHDREFESLVHFLQLAVPTVEKLKLEYAPTRELGIYLKEKGMSRDLYASELSDGTLRAIALFLPIVDPRYSVVVIEEPENCIHPWIIRQFVDACRESVEESGRQIHLTTHSPILVSRLEPSELFLADRVDGQTSIRPATAVEKGLEDVIRQGIMDLGSYWDSGAMKAVPTPPTLFEISK